MDRRWPPQGLKLVWQENDLPGEFHLDRISAQENKRRRAGRCPPSFLRHFVCIDRGQPEHVDNLLVYPAKQAWIFTDRPDRIVGTYVEVRPRLAIVQWHEF